MAPPYVDEDANESMVEQGLETAENEVRDIVADSYEEGALESSESSELLDDIDYVEAEEDEDEAPELDAIHGDASPENDK
ncbi:hypothetical protein OKA04_14505 [Luteolibacter flavescens]|uniref:Uncharacterized protein n=2 Tax=Luteolibacter flavescens TaxID=1859460 RepID=A0ABT3FQV9_9BACT|nr:hypothetical protein [Luteolibacter flavescens]